MLHTPHAVVTLSILITTAGGIAAQIPSKPSLKDLARTQGGTLVSSIDVDMPAASLSTVISEADLVVHARVERIVTALSKDESQVQTLVTFVPVRVFKDKIKSREAASPRMTAPMVFVEAGGTVHVDGLTITQTSGDAITPPLRLGEDLLVCLSKGEQSEYFVLSYGPYGLLRIEGDTVRPANKLVGKTRPLSSYGLSHVVNEVQRLVAETSKKN